MKRFFVYIILCWFPCNVYSQILRETYHDKEEKYIKETYYVNDTINNVLEGPYKSFYLNGQLESQGQFKLNEPNGVWDFYYESGALKMRGQIDPEKNADYWQYFYEQGEGQGTVRMEGQVNNQQRVGEWKFYYQNGQLKESGVYRDNLREGLWKSYYEDGPMLGQVTYQANKGRLTEFYPTGEKSGLGEVDGPTKTGHWTYYYKTNKPKAEGDYSNGKKDGQWTFYFPEGSVSTIGIYAAGKADGTWDYYYESGGLESKGNFIDGKKEGLWKLFYPDGKLLGEGVFENGSGEYKEYYTSGELKILGEVLNGQSHGHWEYFFKDSTLEGQCDFEYGQGTYSGYYNDGSLQTKGKIADGKRVGKWELYEKNGQLAGYYKPIYDVAGIQINEPNAQQYGVADYRYKGHRKGYFKPSLNEFKGLVVGFNPFMSLVGRMPFTLEYYLQERLGYELEIEGIRDPFFSNNSEVSLDKPYRRGFSAAVRQKFYNDGGDMGLWYFGHEIRYSQLTHHANILTEPNKVEIIKAHEKKIEYSLILGYRLMSALDLPGLSLDVFVGAGTGYRNFDHPEKDVSVFNDLPQESITLRASYGIIIGYIFRYEPHGKH